jgi:alkaline phosphatase
MKKEILLIFITLLLAGILKAYENAEVKNVIILISDGCGYNHIRATDYYQHGKEKSQLYENFPIKLAMSTYSAVGKGYDTDKAWNEFDWVKDYYTDSAAAATAMSTGIKTYNGAIGKGLDSKDLNHILHEFYKMGKACGLVSSVEFSHATPAGFCAHNSSRENYEEIAQEILLDERITVIMGCGNPLYDDNGNKLANPVDYQYVGGVKFFDKLINGQIPEITESWKIITERQDFIKLAKGETPARVLGLPMVYKTLQYNRSGQSFTPYDVPFIQTVPDLSEMTMAAINVLESNQSGFFLMVEGGAIDWASHDNDSARMIEEQIDFNLMSENVINWIESHSNWQETLLIVTADHECGYLTGKGSDPKWKEVVNNGKGNIPEMEWNSENHTNSLIPFYAKGKGSKNFILTAKKQDKIHGKFIDNTDIAGVISSLLSTQ